MYQFGVRLRQEADGRIAAVLLDFPSGPRGYGVTTDEAYNDLIKKTTAGLTKFLLGGGRPGAIPEGTPSISVELPTRMHAVMPPSAPARMVTPRDDGATWSYSWRNNTLSTEG